MLPLKVPLSASILGYGVAGSSTVPSSPSTTAVTAVRLTFVPAFLGTTVFGGTLPSSDVKLSPVDFTELMSNAATV